MQPCPFIASRPVLVALGDSITQYGFSTEHSGWLSTLADHYMRKLDVINRGYSGYNTALAVYTIQRSPRVLPAADLTLVFFGANDASSGEWQHVSVQQYYQNLEFICRHLSKVIVITPPMIDHEAWDAHCAAQGKPTGSRSNARVELYADAVRNLAKSLNIGIADLNKAMQSDEQWRTMLCDGLHLNRRGNALLAQVVIDSISSYYPELSRDRILLDAPLWNEFDSKACEESWNGAKIRF
jgi:lysophospholipase L1-like esterase